MARKNACIICGEQKDGLEVLPDNVLNTMRWIKEKTTRKKKDYRLVVCKDCFTKYRKLRSSYERRTTLYVALGVVFTVMLALVSGSRILGAIGYGIALTVFLYLLAQISYMPRVKLPEGKKLDIAK